ncbi:MAG: glycosyl hydrolase [Planctomycetales bacterium]
MGASQPPGVVEARTFSWQQWQEPEAIFWPAYFWLWNGPLEPETLRRQLQDMASHEARNVCVLPMPRDFRPDSTANRMDVDYLSPQFFARVQVAVREAARLKMHYWLYDEGGWPSGQATGRVIGARPDLAVQVLQPDPVGKWTLHLQAGRPDLLNPETTTTFLSTTHEKYQDAVGEHFGSTIRLVFTDEPAYPAIREGREIPWTAGAEHLFQKKYGYSFQKNLPNAFRRAAVREYSPQDLKTRVDGFDFWSGRFQEAYFDPLREWCRAHNGLAHGGHLGGEDETLGAARYGFGQIMRQMRAMDIPGVDLIWRQVFPGKKNHHFPKFASSAAHQNGTALALTESFCVYGNGLTPEQMKWLIDYQYVRGLNVLVAGCYPLSTDDHHMLGERPHFGPVDPLWDLLPGFHRYVARLGYLLACGDPVIDTALYYPVRDIWAMGSESPAAAAHDALAQLLLERQCDFDVIDDDLLSSAETHVEGTNLAAGKMRYRTIVVGPTEFMADASRQKLREFERAGGRVIQMTAVQQAQTAVQGIPPTITLTPRTPDLRAAVRRWKGGGLVMLFNEGVQHYDGQVSVPMTGTPLEMEPALGHVKAINGVVRSGEGGIIPVNLVAGASRLFIFGESESPQRVAEAKRTGVQVDLREGWKARIVRQHRAGERNFEVRNVTDSVPQSIRLGNWKDLAGEDFSGRVEYRCRVTLPKEWHGKTLRLNLGRVDYAARVTVNGQEAGTVLWSPTSLDLPAMKIGSELDIRIEVANTLANELTSERVRTAWGKRTGPGWPGPYHQRALEFERDSRSGGLFGPVTLELCE